MNFDRRLLAAGILIMLLAFAVGVKYQSFNESRAGEQEILLEDVLSDEEQADGSTDSEKQSLIQVYVCGEVKNPGIYRVEAGARLHEVIELAGALEDAELRYLGMARELLDGETVAVPAIGEINPADAGTAAVGTFPSTINSGRVNINQASADEMASKLNGIGPVLASRIIEYRLANGPFKKVEDLKQVTGIGEKKFNDIKDSIAVR